MKASDEADFVDFVTASSPSLLRTAWLLTGDHYLAEEIVQEAFERTYVKWRRIRGNQPHAYVRRIVVNLTTDRWRRLHGETVTRTGELPERQARDDQRTTDDRDQVTRLLKLLPNREREIVVLRYYTDRPEKDVADMLGISVGTLKSAASRGLATLRAALNNPTEVTP